MEINILLSLRSLIDVFQHKFSLDNVEVKVPLFFMFQKISIFFFKYYQMLRSVGFLFFFQCHNWKWNERRAYG